MLAVGLKDQGDILTAALVASSRQTWVAPFKFTRSGNESEDTDDVGQVFDAFHRELIKYLGGRNRSPIRLEDSWRRGTPPGRWSWPGNCQQE